MKIYLATKLSDTYQGTCLSVKYKRERLISYFDVTKCQYELKQYVRKGFNNENQKK